jgi:hypothetical protein
VGGDSDSVLTGALYTPASLFSPLGSYPISQGSLSAGGNYSITFTSGTLSVIASEDSLPPGIASPITQAVIQPATPVTSPSHGRYEVTYVNGYGTSFSTFPENHAALLRQWWNGIVNDAKH